MKNTEFVHYPTQGEILRTLNINWFFFVCKTYILVLHVPTITVSFKVGEGKT
jgi:hypothetical protein